MRRPELTQLGPTDTRACVLQTRARCANAHLFHQRATPPKHRGEERGFPKSLSRGWGRKGDCSGETGPLTLGPAHLFFSRRFQKCYLSIPCSTEKRQNPAVYRVSQLWLTPPSLCDISHHLHFTGMSPPWPVFQVYPHHEKVMREGGPSLREYHMQTYEPL